MPLALGRYRFEIGLEAIGLCEKKITQGKIHSVP